MTDNAAHDDLPELSDEDVALLHQITTLAATSPAPPFKALFAAYDAVFAEQGIEQEHDGVVFRLLLRVGEAAREGRSAGRALDLVGCLRGILAAQGITVVEGDDDLPEDEDVEEEGGQETRSVVVGNANANAQPVNGVARTSDDRRRSDAGRRRVSFDDARLDETWLSEHSRSLIASPPRQQAQRGLLAQPPRRGRYPDGLPGRRARSTSSQRTNGIRQAAPKHHQQASPSTVYTSEHEDTNFNPTLLFQPSQTQLEQNAEAFASTSTIRSARHCLHIWHDRALTLHQTSQQAYAIASAHDRRTLLKQAFDQWRTNHTARVQTRKDDEYWKRREKEVHAHHQHKLLDRAFSHWRWSALDQQHAIAVGQRRILKIRYFRRWRTIAVENAIKARSILARKYLAVWREKLARKLLRDEQATAHYEEAVERRCWKAWFWHLCSRRVDGWREEKVKRRAWGAWTERARDVRQKATQASERYNTHTTHRALDILRQRLAQRQHDAQQARSHRDRALATSSLHSLSISARLNPLARTLTLKIQLDLQRKTVRVWHLHLTLSRQAALVDRKRILQSAWTNWNDALRCKALGQRIDERVVVETLYKWVLAERLRLSQRSAAARLLREVVQTWVGKLRGSRASTAEAEMVFAAAQQRRRLAFGMQALHTAMHAHEDAERAAVEFANLRTLPNILQILAEKTRHVMTLEKWAADARFYTLSTRTLAVWRERATQHVHTRRRDAYAAVRARVKIRLVGTYLGIWHAKTARITAMTAESERRAHARLAAIGTEAFEHWRQRLAQLDHLANQAGELDQHRLRTSGFSALTAGYAQLRSMDDQAAVFRREAELAVLAGVVKKLQWARFTAARRAESAEALWVRNRGLHVRGWLRRWYGLAFERRTGRQLAAQAEAAAAAEAAVEEEPESPSLRPASRAAASRSRSRERHTRERHTLASSPPAAAMTPAAYMRTPSRSSRRAGRFRPLLPTPAPGTPFGLDSAYLLSTTPAPLPSTGEAGGGGEGGGGGGGVGRMNDETLTPQVTPFARKLRAGGFAATSTAGTPAQPVLRSAVFGRSVQQGTAKSVRFAGGSRFGGGGHEKSS
ncbi:hypothetical protein LTR36_009191 [Oleoguttula mirabilis]|uniref:Sfi1 spindle body domain-containing protein n=1 Tax=Oleoguttula mirabilis TaxID=1507867 RepID=A0AAV9J6V3_9PEZI|nr:hypothetical protein LTR36_009191 [Oleoguttula mirabilis]